MAKTKASKNAQTSAARSAKWREKHAKERKAYEAKHPFVAFRVDKGALAAFGKACARHGLSITDALRMHVESAGASK